MRKFQKRYNIIFIVLLFLAAIPAQRFEWFSLIEDQTISFRHQLRLAYGNQKQLSMSKEIVLINTDERFFNAYKSFPLRRTDIGAIVANLKKLGAQVVAIDMLMDFPSSYGEDPSLAKALQDAGNTLLASQAEFQDGKFVKINYPNETLNKVSASAYTNISSNSHLLTMLSRLKIYPEVTFQHNGWPFAVSATAMYLGVEPRIESGMLYLGDLKVPLDHHNRINIDFPPLPTGSRFLSQIAGISALEFLDISALDENDREELALWVRNKIVLIGDTSEVSHDWFDTPVGMVYGIEIIADTIHSLMKGAPLRAASYQAEVAVTMIVMVTMLLLVLLLVNPLLRSIAMVTVMGGFVTFVSVAYVRAGVIFPMAYMLIVAVLSFILVEYRHYMAERNQKQQIAKIFGQYIPAELVDEMNKTNQQVSIGGESRELTVLFSDVRGFTTIAEGLGPQELTSLMNNFLSPMTKVIHVYRGTIDKYMGDAIMAFWGAPLRDDQHARHAVQAALQMAKTLEELNEEHRMERREQERRKQDDEYRNAVRRNAVRRIAVRSTPRKLLKIGIGLNTGAMNVGNMGSDFRLAYTVLGDAVNLGSRLESLTKQYDITIIISEFTRAQVPDLVARELDQVRVKGKDISVRIFEPIGFEGEVDAAIITRLGRYHVALELYRGQKFADAKVAFEALLAEDDRYLYKLYLGRIECFMEEPPEPDWDGIYTHKEK